MTIISQFMDAVSWYRPTEDTDSWAGFLTLIQQGQTAPSAEGQLVQIAQTLATTDMGKVDSGLWKTLQANFVGFFKYYSGQTANSPYASNPIYTESTKQPSEQMQYDYVKCFIVNYDHAAHNKDLWSSMSGAASQISAGH